MEGPFLRGGPRPIRAFCVSDPKISSTEVDSLRHRSTLAPCRLGVPNRNAGWCCSRVLPDRISEKHSAVARPQERKFLGFSFTAGPEVKRIIAPKALDRFKRRIREITRRAKSVSLKTTIEKLAPYMRGWRSYFGFCETPEVLIGLTRWVRLRLRAALWRQWKTPRRRRAALLALGVHPRLASNTAGSGLGPWYLAKAKALSVGISNAYLKSLGLPTLTDGC